MAPRASLRLLTIHSVVHLPPPFAQWIVEGAIEVNIGANASAEGGGEDEGVDDTAKRVVDISNAFRLQETSFEEGQPKKFIKEWAKPWCQAVVTKLTELGKTEQCDEFKAKAKAGLDYLTAKFNDLQL